VDSEDSGKSPLIVGEQSSVSSSCQMSSESEVAMFPGWRIVFPGRSKKEKGGWKSSSLLLAQIFSRSKTELPVYLQPYLLQAINFHNSKCSSDAYIRLSPNSSVLKLTFSL
jgi:hypothetical protein